MPDLKAMTTLVETDRDDLEFSNLHCFGLSIACTMGQVDHAETHSMTGSPGVDIGESNSQVPITLIQRNIELNHRPTENIERPVKRLGFKTARKRIVLPLVSGQFGVWFQSKVFPAGYAAILGR